MYLELLITAMIIGAVSIVTESTVDLVLGYLPYSSGASDLAVLSTLSQLVDFLIVPVALFLVVYYLAAEMNTDLTETFFPMIVSLFIGALLGYSVAYLGVIFLAPNLTLGLLSDYSAIAIFEISRSLEVVFVGFGSITLQYLLSGKLRASMK